MDDLMPANDCRHIGRGLGVVGWIGNERKVLSSTFAMYLSLSGHDSGPLFLVCYFCQLGVGWKGIPLCSECVFYYVCFFAAA